MTEVDQLKKRIYDSGFEGMSTSMIREDYNPVGAIMLHQLCDTGEYVQRRVPEYDFNSEWKIFYKDVKPY